MFRQIKVNADQTYLLNILWREHPSQELQCLELLTVTYGTNSAPFLATRVLKEIALRNKERFPLAFDALLAQCYMDDILAGSNSLEELQMEGNSNKVLGAIWKTKDDFLSVSVPETLKLPKLTKRTVLSLVAQCFDPLESPLREN